MFIIYIKKEYEVFTYSDLCSLALQENEKLTDQQRQDILVATVNQNKSKEWFNQRKRRITVPNFKRACKTSISKPSLSLVRTVYYPLTVNLSRKLQIGDCIMKIQHYKLINWSR